MFNLHHKSDLREIERFSCALTQAQAKLAAISRSMAMIEFDRDGVVLDANENFCRTMGYSAEEVRGKHHRIFCEEAYYRSDAYAKLWRDLAQGEPISGTFMRLTKSGQEVWLEASYMPVYGPDKQVQSVIKVASDISERVHHEHENQSLIDAIGRSMAVIEFTPQGQILNANQNFLTRCSIPSAKSLASTTPCSATAPRWNHRLTKRSGRHLTGVNSTPIVLSGATSMVRRCFWKPRTTLSSMPAGVCTKW